MKKSLLITIALISTSIHAKKFNLEKISISSGVAFDIVEAENIKSRVFGYNLSLYIQDSFAPDLKAFLGATASLETGSNQVNATVAEFEPNEGINLDQGGLIYQPTSILRFRIGALNQSDFDSPLLLGNSAFAAIEEKISIGPFYFKAQQAIPSNNKLTKRIGTIDKGTPYLSTETLGMDIGHKRSLKLEASHFKFKDLSNNIAEQSSSFGNSVTGIGNSIKYNYEFDGYNVVLDSKYNYGNSSFFFSGEYLYNNEAPSKRNTGTLARIGYGYKTISFQLESFRNESDTAPAFYNSKYYGHNNIKGSAASFKFIDKDLDMKLRFTSFTPIEDNASQAKTEMISFNLSKKYEF